jgi:hypothetical protein
MIRRIDDKPKLVNPSGWISEGRMPTAQEATLVESGSTRSRSSIREPEPINPTLVQSPEPIHSQPSGQQPNDLEVESESELEDLNEYPVVGGGIDAFLTREHSHTVSLCLGGMPSFPVDIVHSLSSRTTPTFASVPTS